MHLVWFEWQIARVIQNIIWPQMPIICSPRFLEIRHKVEFMPSHGRAPGLIMFKEGFGVAWE